jgi:hypothetical protein
MFSQLCFCLKAFWFSRSRRRERSVGAPGPRAVTRKRELQKRRQESWKRREWNSFITGTKKDFSLSFSFSCLKRIAEHFSQTRHTPWPRVAQFVKKISRGSKQVV